MSGDFTPFLTAEQKEKRISKSLITSFFFKFDRDGYLPIPNFFTPAEADKLRLKALKLLDEFDIETHPKTKFTTGEEGDDVEHVGDDYFLESGDKIRFFFEEDAIDEKGELKVEKAKSINKIGHALHELDQDFRALSTKPELKSIAKTLGFHDPRVLQSMVICKQPRIGGRVPPHQDSTFLYTNPTSAVGFWFALEDCTPENGCLSFAPGSHKTQPVTKRFVRAPNGKGTTFINIAESSVPEPGDDAYVCEPVKTGTLVLIHGSVLHKSPNNTSSKSRFIYTFHVIEGANEYPKDNW